MKFFINYTKKMQVEGGHVHASVVKYQLLMTKKLIS